MGPILEDRDYEMSHGAKGLADFSKRIINSKVGRGCGKYLFHKDMRGLCKS